MKKTLTVLLLVFVMMLSLVSQAFANQDITLDSILTCDGQTTVIKQSGDIITVTYTLQNATEESDYYVSFHTNEIYYDPTFFEYVPESATVVNNTNVQTQHKEWSAEPHNCITFAGTPFNKWKSVQTVGTFKLKIIATDGESEIYSKDGNCGVQSNVGYYPLTLNKLKVKIGNAVNYDVEVNEYVTGKSIVLVYTDQSDISFIYRNNFMYDVTSKYKKDGYEKTYAMVTDTIANGTTEDYKADIAFEYVPLNDKYIIEALTDGFNYDINNSGGFTISDVIVVYGVFYVEPSYFPYYMPEILKADINNDKCVNIVDTELCRDVFINAKNK